jgi:hypothetical protein
MSIRPLLAVGLLVAGCGWIEPIGPLPGGRLGGEVVREPVNDWSFTDAHDTIAVETRPDDPYSVTVWCFTHGGHLYVPSRDPQEKTWVKYVLADDRVRLKIGDKIYERRAVRVTDQAEIEAAAPTLLEKYDLERPPPDEAPEVWVFRMEPVRPGRPGSERRATPP